MPTGITRISDLSINPTLFSNGVNLESLALDLFVQSGAVVHDPALDQFLSGAIGGPKITVRHLLPLGVGDDPDISNDNPDDYATPAKVGSIVTSAVRQSLNRSFSEMDLAVDLYGSDPLRQLQGQLSKYWLTVRQKRLLLSLQGIVAESVANHGGDLQHDIAGENYAELTPDMLINPTAIIDAASKMGDRSRELTGLIVHSSVFATMQKLNMIETVRLSDNDIFIDMFMGFPVSRDDGLTVEVIPERPSSSGVTYHDPYNVYHSYLFGPGAFALGVGLPKTPFEIERKALAGQGGGQEIIVSRQELVIHPNGYKCNLDVTPTVAQLKAAATWTRAWEDRKRIPLVDIRSRG
jgi:hypothetical protein